RLRLAAEAAHEVLIPAELAEEQLHGHVLAHVHVLDLVHGAHAALAELREHAVAAIDDAAKQRVVLVVGRIVVRVSAREACPAAPAEADVLAEGRAALLAADAHRAGPGEGGAKSGFPCPGPRICGRYF